MSRRGRVKSVSQGYPVRVNGVNISWYSYGCQLREAGHAMPQGVVHPHLMQGWRKVDVRAREFQLKLEIRAYIQGKFNWLPSLASSMDGAVELYKIRYERTL